jgi:arylsulfatase A
MKTLLSGILLCASTVLLAGYANGEDRPNIVLILADDLGINDLHCYGRADHKTPNLDGLAASGTQFNCAYCALPICSASRAGLMTSKYPARLHLTSYLPGRADAPSQKLLQPRIEPALIPSEQTIAEVLKSEGYATGIFGKWHLGGGDSAPTKQGFEIAFEPTGNGDPATTGGKNEFLITDKAIEFIKAQKEKPFFCYVPHHTPHIMLKEQPAKIEQHAAAWNPEYAATIKSLDEAVGRLLKAIDESPGAENTIVIFTSDNGGLHVPEGHEEPVTHNGNFRAGKGYLYEGGLRVPLLIRWPKQFATAQKLDAPVSLMDILPTLCEAAKINVGRTVGPIDGQSISALLVKDAPARKAAISAALERKFYWHIPHYTNQGSRPAGAIRVGDWKLVEDYETGAVELYDLQKDLSEQNNLLAQSESIAAAHAGMSRKLHDSLVTWRKSIAAQELTPNPNFDVSLHRELYLDQDPTKFLGKGQTAHQIAAEWNSWRQGMNKAVAGKKTILNNTADAIKLPASTAKVHGSKIRYEPETNKNVVGYWTEVEDWAEWEFESTIQGKAEIQIHCGCQGGGSEVDVILKAKDSAEQVLKWTVRNTGHFQNIVIETLGEVTLKKEKCVLEVRPRKKAGAAVTDIRQILLVPIAMSN